MSQVYLQTDKENTMNEVTYECNVCEDTGWVCERHPSIPWPGNIGTEAEHHHANHYDGCRAPGLQCECNSPITK